MVNSGIPISKEVKEILKKFSISGQEKKKISGQEERKISGVVLAFNKSRNPSEIILHSEFENGPHLMERFKKVLTEEPMWGVLDFQFKRATDKNDDSRIFLVNWINDNMNVKLKMLSSTSVSEIKNALLSSQVTATVFRAESIEEIDLDSMLRRVENVHTKQEILTADGCPVHKVDGKYEFCD